jgi:hypothetical protein
LRAALAPRLCVLETPAIRQALRTLWQDTPRWEGGGAQPAYAVQ